MQLLISEFLIELTLTGYKILAKDVSFHMKYCLEA